jgi:TctA family transporter
MALLLGAFLMLGIQPGPEMMTKHLDLSLTLLLSLIAANVIATGICFIFAPFMAKVAIIPNRFLAPFVIVIAIVGVYVYRETFADVIVALLSTVIGLGMILFGLNRAALILGFVLGRLFEHYLFIAIGVDGPLFFLRPICIILILIVIALFTFAPLKRLLKGRKE